MLSSSPSGQRRRFVRRGRSAAARVAFAIEAVESRILLATFPAGFTDSQVGSGLTSPTAIEVAPDGRVFLAQQNGVIRVIQNDQLLPTPFADLSPLVNDGGERGMLGITLDPGFATNGYVYVYYTAESPSPHNRISRLIANGNTMLPNSETVLVDFPGIGGAIWHMGGAIHFGADGKLYVGIGDHQQPNNAQSLSSVFGKILRFNADGSIPNDNPFYNQTTGINRSIYSYGLRNPFTFDIHPTTGQMFINDVGNSAWEEINEGIAGANYGWPTTEGSFNPSQYPNFTLPVYAYPHAQGQCIAGAMFYSPANKTFPAQYHDQFFFVDFSQGWMRTMNPQTKVVSNFGTGMNFPTDMTVAPNGAIYYLQRGMNTGNPTAGSGSVRKLAYTANVAPTIVEHPENQSGAAGQQATFSVSALGTSPLSYQWRRNGQNISGANESTYTRTIQPNDAGAVFTCVVTNLVGNVTSNGATISVLPGTAPVPTINTPAADMKWFAGQTVSFSGSATDADDGVLPASAFTWQIDYITGAVSRPLLLPTSGVTSGSVQVPDTSPYTATSVALRIILTVRDSVGAETTITRDLSPQVSSPTFNTNIPGLAVTLDGTPFTTPIAIDGVVGLKRELSAAEFQTLNGVTYQFVSWANGADRTHLLSWPTTSQTYTATYAAVPLKYLSDLNWTSATNGWGPVERDRSNGEQGATDGGTITLNGVTYAKGLGVHANSSITYNLSGQYEQFLSDIGIDDETGNNGSAVFEVWVDNARVFQSPTMTGSSTTRQVNVDVRGAQTLRLVVTNGGNGADFDHADWAGARLIEAAPVPIPAPPTNLLASLNGSKIDLSWNDASSDETGFRVERRIGANGTWSQIAQLPAGTTAYADSSITPGNTHYYRVYAYNAGGNSAFTNEASVPVPVSPGTTYLSDLTWTSATNGWGPVERDLSNGSNGTSDGPPLRLAGVQYAKGLGVHANSSITYNLNGQYAQFLSDIGVDDAAETRGSVVFQVFVDNVQVYTSPLMTGTSATQQVSINVAGAQTLRLVVLDGGNGNEWDHGNWAAARLVAGNAPIAQPDTATTDVNEPVQIDVVSNDFDPNGSIVPSTVTIATPPAHGSVSVHPVSGVVTYTPSPDYSGVDEFFYTVRDNDGTTSSPAKVSITIGDQTPTTQTWLSDLNWSSATNGWGAVEKDRSNGELGPSDGRTITLNGVTYAKGLGVHANSSITYNLNGQYTQFLSDIGVDDESGSSGSVIFQVYVDNVLAYTSPTMTGSSATLPVSVDVTGKSTLRLVVTDAGNGNAWDHADWAGARLISGASQSAPAAPTNLAAALNGNRVDLTWVDPASNESGFRIQRKTGAAGAWADIGTAPMNATSFADTGPFASETSYFYQVIAFNPAGDSAPSNDFEIVTPAAPPTTETWLSDLNWSSATNGWGAVEKDRSNGEQGAADGGTITLNGVTYAKGLGVHANSSITYNLNGQYSAFQSDIGVDDYVGNAGSVIFEVWVDNVRVYQSPVMTGASATQQVHVDLTGAQTLRLAVVNAGDGMDSDHGDWAGARLIQ